MNHLHRCALAVAMLFCLAANLHAAEQVYYLPLNGHLHVNVPDGWSATYTPAKGSWDQPTIRLEHADAVLTFVPLKADGTAIPGNEEVKILTNNAVTPYWKRSTDRNLKFDELVAGDVYGQFGHYTIAKPAEGEKPNVTVGLIRLDRVLITTTILYDADKKPASAMEIVRGLKLDVATPVRLRTRDGAFSLAVDGRWKVTELVESFADKPHHLKAEDLPRGLTVAIHFDPAQPRPADAGETSDRDRARAYFLAKLKADGATIKDAKESTVAYGSVAEWDNGGEHHALSCYAADGTWMSVHLVKAKYDEKVDRALLDELLNSVLPTREKSIAQPGKKKIGAKKEAPPKPSPKKDDGWGAD